jgi:surfactin synthase thioesterase subunit
LVISGQNDKLFIAAGAEGFKKDITDAQINLLNGGHFVLEEKHAEAASVIKSFLSKKVLHDFNDLPNDTQKVSLINNY